MPNSGLKYHYLTAAIAREHPEFGHARMPAKQVPHCHESDEEQQ